MKKILLLLMLVSPVWADDLWIVSPLEDQQISGSMTMQVQQPIGNPQSIRVRMVLDVYNGPDKTVWTGELHAKDNYTLQLDIATFPKGKYEVEFSYFHQGKVFDEEVDVYII
ncbi:MAG: hypothetical protein ACRC9L_06985 [Brevinema sp.]